MIYFKKLLDSEEYEISSYVKKYLREFSDFEIKIHVGCDSQNISQHTNYATTVLFILETLVVIFYIKKKNSLKLMICGPNFGEKQQGQ